MPRITEQWAAVSTVTGWENKEVAKNTSFPSLKPKFRTSDFFKDNRGRLPYRDQIDQAQVYTQESRKSYLSRLKNCLHKFPCDRTLQVRWRFDKEVPAFSMDFLFFYLSRFGKVEAIYQQAVNACLVLFKHHRTAWLVGNTHDLGLPYGRLYTRFWNPSPQDKDQLIIMKHIEKASETRTRFHSLMDQDDRLASKSLFRANSRAIADGNKQRGPSLKAYLCEGVRRMGLDTAEPFQKNVRPRVEVKHGGVIHFIKHPAEFEQLIQGDKLVVVDFFATWCGPCKIIAPVIEQWVKEFPDVLFAKIDVDEVPEICDEFRVSAMPTFLFFKNHVKLDTLVGAFQDKIRERILALK